jgi:hypothetical protein
MLKSSVKTLSTAITTILAGSAIANADDKTKKKKKPKILETDLG